MTDQEIKDLVQSTLNAKDNKWFILGSIMASIAATGAFLYSEINEDRVNQTKFNQQYVLGVERLQLDRDIKEKEVTIKQSVEQRAIDATKAP